MSIFGTISNALRSARQPGVPTAPTIDPALAQRLASQGTAGATRTAQILNPNASSMTAGNFVKPQIVPNAAAFGSINATAPTSASTMKIAPAVSNPMIDRANVPPPVIPMQRPAVPNLSTSSGQNINPSTGGVSDNPNPAPANTGGATLTYNAATGKYDVSQNGGGASAPAAPAAPAGPAPAPTPPAVDNTLSDAEKAYQANLEVTPEEQQAQQDLDTLDQSYKTAYMNTDNQAIPLDFITGQQKALENRSLALSEPLEKKLARLQAKRQSSLAASKFALERADAANKPTEVGNSLVKKQADGTYKSVYSAPSENKPTVLGQGDKLVDSTGKEIANNPKSTTQTEAEKTAAAAGVQLKTDALTSAQELLRKFQSGNTFAVGGSSVFGTLPGTASRDFTVQFNNLKSLLSLDNVKLLKGQGQVSDAERKLLAEASAKLELSQSEPEFQSALQGIISALSGQSATPGANRDQAYQTLSTEFPGLTEDEKNQLLQEQGFNQPLSMGENGSAQQIAAAIKQVESGGNYNAKGGSGENGAYQFMPSTWKGWAQQYLGDPNAPMTPANQDKVAIAKITDLQKKGYNAQQIALIWNGGQPVVKKGVNSFGVKYDSGSYANKVLTALKSIS